jgi:hypothetical protein
MPINGERLPRRRHVHEHRFVFRGAGAVRQRPAFRGVGVIVFDLLHGGETPSYSVGSRTRGTFVVEAHSQDPLDAELPAVALLLPIEHFPFGPKSISPAGRSSPMRQMPEAHGVHDDNTARNRARPGDGFSMRGLCGFQADGLGRCISSAPAIRTESFVDPGLGGGSRDQVRTLPRVRGVLQGRPGSGRQGRKWIVDAGVRGQIRVAADRQRSL